MQLPFFYEPGITVSVAPFILSEETSKHCIQVLRMKAGEQIQLTDGCGNLCTATITQEHKKHCSVAVSNHVFVAPVARRVEIAVALVKNNTRMEWLMEKLTEIGIAAITPLVTARTEKQHFRSERMHGILISAMLQSRQTHLPVLATPLAFDQYVAQDFAGQKLVAHCIEEDKTSLATIPAADKARLLIGPEGDFTPAEIAFALQHGYKAVSLGQTRLRTETAAMVGAVLLVNK